ncbi:MAG: hypothetical protein PHU05_01425 [Bacilli bacterium]|nr:hypothetical protein [Bacilli bacterium]
MIVNFIKKIFSYFIKFILVFFPKKETTKIKSLNKVKEKKDEVFKKDKKIITSIPDSRSEKTMPIFNFKKNKTEKLYNYLIKTNNEIIEINNDLKVLIEEIIKNKSKIGYTYELNIIEKRIKTLNDDYHLLKRKNFFKTSDFQIKELDKFKLLKSDATIKRIMNVYNYINKIDFNFKKEVDKEKSAIKKNEEKEVNKEKSAIKKSEEKEPIKVTSFQKQVTVNSKTKIEEIKKPKKEETKNKKVIKIEEKKIVKKEEVKKPDKYDDIFNSIDSCLETIKINNRIKKQTKKGKRKLFSSLFFLVSFAKSIQLKIKLNSIKNELRQEYVDSVNINNTIRNMRNIVEDVELEYITVSIEHLTDLSKTKDKTIEVNLDILEQINTLEQALNNKYSNAKTSRLIVRLKELKSNIEYQMIEIPELQKKKEKIII